MEVTVRIEEIKEIERENGKEEDGGSLAVKMKDRKRKMEVTKKKVALRGMVRIEED